jgi:hypothetical protein
MSAPEPTAAPTPGPAGIPVITDFLRLLRVLVSPGAVFEEQREAPTFWVPWLLFCVLMLVASFVSFPYQLAAARLGAAAAGRPFPAAAETVMKFSMVVAIPVFSLVMMLLTAGVMYLVLMGSGSEVRYKGLLSVTVFSGAMLGVLQILATFAVLKLRGPIEGLTTAADFQASFGLDLLLPADATVPKFVEGMMKGISPFSLWGLALTAIGIRTVEKTSKGAAWTAATVSLVLGLLIAGISAKAFGPR